MFSQSLMRRAVHPHGCGDNATRPCPPDAIRRFTPTGVGTTGVAQEVESGVMRFTPTGVGTTLYCDCGNVHSLRFTPTGVGTTMQCAPHWWRKGGSPPRVWGQLESFVHWRQNHRFTPTGVGTTARSGAAVNRSTVHPHGCGDNALRFLILSVVGGSPPRVWGQPRKPFLAFPARRFTPTGVGTTPCLPTSSSLRAVHPHGCGDNPCGHGTASRQHGSPPRVWGQPATGTKGTSIFRFTPTGVGTTVAGIIVTTWPAVHPHGCGDNWS